MNQQFDLVNVIFEGAEDAGLFSEDWSELNSLMKRVKPLIPAELFHQLELAASERARSAALDAFRLGWRLRAEN